MKSNMLKRNVTTNNKIGMEKNFIKWTNQTFERTNEWIMKVKKQQQKSPFIWSNELCQYLLANHFRFGQIKMMIEMV